MPQPILRTACSQSMANTSLPLSSSRRTGTRKAAAPMSRATTGAVSILPVSSMPRAVNSCGPKHHRTSETTMIQMATCSYMLTGPSEAIFLFM